jgi:post-segregation antitoxin (ccd killing protein)
MQALVAPTVAVSLDHRAGAGSISLEAAAAVAAAAVDELNVTKLEYWQEGWLAAHAHKNA